MRIDNLKFHTRIYMISLSKICIFRRNEKMSQSVDLVTLVEIYKTDHSLYNTFCDIKDISLKEQFSVWKGIIFSLHCFRSRLPGAEGAGAGTRGVAS